MSAEPLSLNCFLLNSGNHLIHKLDDFGSRVVEVSRACSLVSLLQHSTQQRHSWWSVSASSANERFLILCVSGGVWTGPQPFSHGGGASVCVWLGSRRTDGSVNIVCFAFLLSSEIKLVWLLRRFSGLGHHNVTSTPTAVGGELAGVQVKHISTYGDCSLAVSADGQLYGWGNSEYLQLASATEATQVRKRKKQHWQQQQLFSLLFFSADQLTSTAPAGGLWEGGSGSVWRHSGGRPQRSVGTYTLYT